MCIRDRYMGNYISQKKVFKFFQNIKMKYLAAYCLAALSGKKTVAKDDIVKILKSVGIEPVADNIDRLLNAMKGKELHQVIAEGLKKVGTLAAPAAVAAAPSQSQPKKEQKKEEPKKEEKKEEEEEVDLGAGGLFGDDDF
eukprot:TRINITY_DN406_c0_g2_i1.p3 TRINITY_DN406_c0_g2~~TRINITY_DN406_c0_g2_i1.p3  ORF type:complete len:140 (+),score=49.25 TRINITY_DN406_c0_g2_i1:118-537(+)